VYKQKSGGVGQSAVVLFHLDPHQCAEMCSEIAEPEHRRVHRCLWNRERVGDSRRTGDNRCWRFRGMWLNALAARHLKTNDEVGWDWG
jgi:hypothetical protein